MAANFASAAARHLSDARNLASVNRWDNAGYLAGYVGECGAKAVIETASILVKLHVDRLSARVLALAADVSLAARRYPLDLDPDMEILRQSWKPDLRYSRTGSLDRGGAEKFLDAARRVFERTVVAMVLDGLLNRMPE